MRWGVVKSHLNCSRWRQPSKIEKGPHCSFGGPKRKLNHYQNFMLAENYKRRKFEHLIEIGLNIQVLESSAFGSCTKSTEREKKIVQFRLNRQWKKNNTECITLQHRKWRMQSKRKELKRVYENYHATIQGKNDTYIQPKRNKTKRKEKQNRTKKKPDEEQSIIYRLGSEKWTWLSDDSDTVHKISSRASILNLTTTHRFQSVMLTRWLTRSFSCAARMLPSMGRNAEEFRLFSG